MNQGTSTILMLVVMFALMYFLMIRPENKRKKKAQELRDSLKKGDVITVREESRSSVKIKELIEGLDSRIAPKWLVVDKENVKATIENLPVREDIDFPFEEQLIVELYSK